MKKVEFSVFEKNVKTYISEHNGSYIVKDIDIGDDVETLFFGLNKDEIIYDLKDVNKTFPNIKNFILMPDVSDIKIKNKMFPNVRCVVSYCDSYKSGSMLVEGGTLLNSFCLKEDEVLDLKGIYVINEYALDGCCALDINYDKDAPVTLFKHSVSGSRYEKEPFLNGIQSYQGFIFGIDESSSLKNIVLDKHMSLNILPNNISCNSFTVSSLNQLQSLKIASTIKSYTIDKLIIDNTAKGLALPSLLNLIKSVCRTMPLKHVEISEQVVACKSIDGAVYSKDGTILYYVPQNRTKPLVIPEGVRSIETYAAMNSSIEYVIFPKSLHEVGNNAFLNSYVKSVIFSQSCKATIQLDAFKNCKNMKKIVLPDDNYITNFFLGGCKSLYKVVCQKSLKKISSFNFSHVKEFDILGNIVPDGIEFIANLHGSSSRGYFFTVNFKGKKYFIPKDILDDNIRNLKYKLKNEENTGIYQLSSNAQCKQEAAVAEALEYHTKESIAYVRRCGKVIIDRALEKKMDDEHFAAIISNDLLTVNSLKYLMEKVENTDNTTLKAYILNKLNTVDDTDTGFGL